MRVTLENGVLVKGIHALQNTINTRSTLPILANTLIETKDGQLQLSGTDLELGITTTVTATVHEAGATTIPIKRFGDLIKELPQHPITITVKKNHIAVVECGTSHFKLMGLPPEEFPKLPTIQEQHPLQLSQEMLLRMLNLTAFSMSHDETRYILNGAFISAKKGRVRIVATDGRRLAVIEQAVSGFAPTQEYHAIIPTKTVHELHRLLGNGDTVTIIFGANQIKFDLGQTTIVSRTIEGEFPNYEQVIPPEAHEKVSVSREALLLAIRRASLWTTQESQSIKLDLVKNLLIVSKQTPELGEAREEVAAEYRGPEVSVGFNPSYLMDVLKNLSDETIELELPGPERPGVVRTKDHYTYIVLPMQLT